MAANSSERVKQLIENFMTYHKKGLSIPEIADEFRLTSRTVYLHLQEIADLNGVDRTSLLTVPHRAHTMSSRVKKLHEDVNPIELQKDFAEMISVGNEVVSKIDTILNEESNNYNKT